MTRIRANAAFTKASDADRAVLVGYLPTGFPSVEGAGDVIEAMVEGGVDVVEVGLPYSDPVMDGPTIQRAADMALRGGVRTHDVFSLVERVAALGVPTLVMTYWNLVEHYGVEQFSTDLATAGGAGLITPDLIPEEAPEWIAASDAHDLDRVFLVAPSSTDARLAATTEACRGFVYAASVMGVTGARVATSELAPVLVARTRGFTDLPIGVGLGVSDGRQCAEVAAYADAVIVGSAFVRKVLDHPGDVSASAAACRDLAEDLATGLARG